MIKKAFTAVAVLAMLAGCASGTDDSANDAAAATSVTTAPATNAPATSAPATNGGSAAEPATPDASTAATEAATVEPDSTDTTTTQATTAPSASAETTTDETATTTASAATGPLTVQELLDLGRPIVLAHAGGEDEHPHSTPYAYAESVKAGVDMLDFDVQLTADGELVVQHDDSTGRTTDQDLAIADTDYADLAKLDNAYWFTSECTCTGKPDSEYILRGMRTGDVAPLPGYAPDDFIIPRFEDIVERFPNMPVNIEVKGSGATAYAAVYELARILVDHDMVDNAVVTSFDDLVVSAFHELAPDVEVTPGLSTASAFILGGTPLPTGMRILQLPPVYEGIDVLSKEHIAAAHAAGYVIWVWPNDRYYENVQGYESLLLGGMDGLNINFPAQGVQAVEELFG